MEHEEIDSWFVEHLFNSQDWYPERMGPRRVIFSRTIGATLFSMAFDPAPELSTWRKLPGKSYTESLFELLRPIVEKDASVVSLTFPDSAWIEMHGHYQLDSSFWTPWLLRFFEETPTQEGGPQVLVVLLRGRRGVLTFELFGTLEVAYYGADDLWEELSKALWDKPVGLGEERTGFLALFESPKDYLACGPHSPDFEDLKIAIQSVGDGIIAKLPPDLARWDNSVQDAAYLRTLVMSCDAGALTELRFSQYGMLVVFTNEDMVTAPILQIVRACLSEHGFNYVSETELGSPFRSRNRINDDWFHRFFDYL